MIRKHAVQFYVKYCDTLLFIVLLITFYVVFVVCLGRCDDVVLPEHYKEYKLDELWSYIFFARLNTIYEVQ